MKTEEDEVFEDIERRQGGLQAKRAMAADKLRDCVHGSLAHSCQICDLEAEVEELKASLAQPAQEPVAWQWLGSAHFRKKLPKNADVSAWNPLYANPPKGNT